MCVNRKNNVDFQEFTYPEEDSAKIKKVSSKEAERAATKETSHTKRNLLIIAGIMLALGTALLIGAAIAGALLIPPLVFSATTICIAATAALGVFSIITGLVLGIIALTRKNNFPIKHFDNNECKSAKPNEFVQDHTKKSDSSKNNPVNPTKDAPKTNPVKEEKSSQKSQGPPNANSTFDEAEKKLNKSVKDYLKRYDENNDWRIDIVTSELEARFEGNELNEDEREILKLFADCNKNTVPKYRAHHNHENK